MRAGYYGYFIQDESTGEKYLHDLRGFFKNYCTHGSVDFKSSFVYGGEHKYIFNSIGDMYMFATTRSNEIIKKIDSESLSVHEIYDVLSKNEQLGFASYFYLKKNIIAFASTMLAPKAPSLCTYVNALFEKIGLDSLRLVFVPMMHQSSRSDIMSMPFIGKTTIQINKYSTFCDELRSVIGIEDDDMLDFDSFELVIKPQNKKSIDKIVKKFLSKIPDAGMERFIAKAKDESADILTELYLIGQGAISDSFEARDEPTIHRKFLAKMADNQILKNKITEFLANDYETTPAQALLHYSHDSGWADFVPDVQMSGAG